MSRGWTSATRVPRVLRRLRPSPVVSDDRLSRNRSFAQWLAFGFTFDPARGGQEVERLDTAMTEWRRADGGDWAKATADEQDAWLDALLTGVVRGALTPVAPDDCLLLGLSGGHDSRALAAVWADATGEPIRAFTYGRPGTMDWNLVTALGPRPDLRVHWFDLRTLHWDRDELVSELRGQPDRHLSPRSVVWPELEREHRRIALGHGFLNGPLTGQGQAGTGSWDQDRQAFVASRDAFGFQDALGARAVMDLLPQDPWPGVVPFEIQLAWLNQRQRIEPVSTPARTMLLPFADDRWCGFWLNRSAHELRGRRRWLEFLRRRHSGWFPELVDWDGSEPVRPVVRRWAAARVPARDPGDPGPVRLSAEHCWPSDYRDNASFRRVVDDAVARLRARRVLHDRFVDDRLRRWRRGTPLGWRALRGLVATEFALACDVFDDDQD